MRAGIDLDGCLYGWEPYTRELIARRTGIVLPESSHYNSLRDAVTPEVWAWLWDTQVEEMFSMGAAHGEGISAVRLLAETHDIVVITKRPRQAAVATLQFLADQRIPAIEVHILDHEARKSSVPCDWYVDDAASVVEELAEAGKTVYLFDRPWNQGCEAGIRVKSWYNLLVQVGVVK